MADQASLGGYRADDLIVEPDDLCDTIESCSVHGFQGGLGWGAIHATPFEPLLSQLHCMKHDAACNSDFEDDGMSSEEKRLDQSASTLFTELLEVESRVASWSRPRLKGWLLAFYLEHNRSKIAEIDAIMEKYKGREVSLVQRLERKYAPPWYKEFSSVKNLSQLLYLTKKVIWYFLHTFNWWFLLQETLNETAPHPKNSICEQPGCLLAPATSSGHVLQSMKGSTSPLLTPPLFRHFIYLLDPLCAVPRPRVEHPPMGSPAGAGRGSTKHGRRLATGARATPQHKRGQCSVSRNSSRVLYKPPALRPSTLRPRAWGAAGIERLVDFPSRKACGFSFEKFPHGTFQLSKVTQNI